MVEQTGSYDVVVAPSTWQRRTPWVNGLAPGGSAYGPGIQSVVERFRSDRNITSVSIVDIDMGVRAE